MTKDVRTGRPDTPSEGSGTWVFFIRTTYPDTICYRPGCDDRECRVLLLERVRIGEHATIPPGCVTSGILLRRHSTRMSHIRNSSPPPFHPNILHSTLDAGWERRAFQLPRSDISGSSESAYPESFAAILNSAAVKDHLEWQVLGERYEPLQDASVRGMIRTHLVYQLIHVQLVLLD
uniref:Uncharacterized protein n=1 Tax=Vitis vinifera TaxID=29760 RepID=A5BCU8_VITVI|nr:hypothetical protein VITISV_009525 [Vitis vinifera]